MSRLVGFLLFFIVFLDFTQLPEPKVVRPNFSFSSFKKQRTVIIQAEK